MGIIKLSIKQMPCHCAAVFKAEAREQLIAALEPFQTAFLGKSVARLSEFVNSIFPTLRTYLFIVNYIIVVYWKSRVWAKGGKISLRFQQHNF
jgi:hypothetical protein